MSGLLFFILSLLCISCMANAVGLLLVIKCVAARHD